MMMMMANAKCIQTYVRTYIYMYVCMCVYELAGRSNCHVSIYINCFPSIVMIQAFVYICFLAKRASRSVRLFGHLKLHFFYYFDPAKQVMAQTSIVNIRKQLYSLLVVEFPSDRGICTAPTTSKSYASFTARHAKWAVPLIFISIFNNRSLWQYGKGEVSMGKLLLAFLYVLVLDLAVLYFNWRDAHM